VNLRVEVLVGRVQSLGRDCAINLDDIQTINHSQVSNQIGRVQPNKMRTVNEAIRFALDLPRFQE
jgi:mRNA-degrading endonuclease toxin of MazEF toxin-antitoxin module